MISGAAPYRRKLLLSYPEFWFWFTGETVSSLGTNVSVIAIPWLVLVITHSALQSSLTIALEFVPYLFFSGVAGAMADRWNRKNLLIWTNILRALILFSLPLLYEARHLSMMDIYAASFLNAAISVWFNAAKSSVLPRLLPSDAIHQGNSLMQLGNAVAAMVGPSLGGALMAVMPVAWALSFDALSYLIAGLLVWSIKTPLQAARNSRDTRPDRSLVGLRYLLCDPMLRSSAFIMSISNFANFASFSILVFYSRDVLHLSAGWTAVILGAFGMGLFVGSVGSSMVSGRLQSGNVMLASRILSIVPSLLFATVASPYGLVSAAALNGVWMVLWNVQSASFRQLHVPDVIRGRVTSVHSMLAWIMIPVGAMVGGFLAQPFKKIGRQGGPARGVSACECDEGAKGNGGVNNLPAPACAAPLSTC